MSTLEDFEKAPSGATATRSDGLRAMKIGYFESLWIGQNGLYLSNEQVWGRDFTLDPLPEPLQPTEEETK